MKQYFAYSTLANDNLYVQYTNGPNGIPVRVLPGVMIQGGAGVADDRVWTPRGMVTTIDEDELKYLQKCPAFARHVERGFVVIESSKVDPEKVAPNMSDNDPSRPMTDSSPQVATVGKVSTGTPGDDETGGGAKLPKGNARKPAAKRGA